MATMQKPKSIFRKSIKKLDDWKAKFLSDSGPAKVRPQVVKDTGGANQGPTAVEQENEDHRIAIERLAALEITPRDPAGTTSETDHVTATEEPSPEPTIANTASSEIQPEEPTHQAVPPSSVGSTEADLTTTQEANTAVVLHQPDLAVGLPQSSSEQQVTPYKPDTDTTKYTKSVLSTAWTIAKESLRALDKCADIFPPLKVATSLIVDVLDRFDKVDGVDEESAEFSAKVVTLTKMIEGLRGSTSQEMKVQLDSLARYFMEAKTRLEAKLKHQIVVRYFAADEDAGVIREEIRRMGFVIEVFMMNTAIQSYTILDSMQSHFLMESSLGLVRGAEFKHEDRPCCMQGTRLGLLADLLSWASDADVDPILWIGGIVGTGKTTVAESFCRILATKDLLAGSFFCSRKAQDRRDVRRIFPSLARSFARAYLPYRQALLGALKLLDGDDILGMNIDQQFRSLVVEPLKTFNEDQLRVVSAMTFVIDALDECDDHDAMEQFLNVILDSSESHECPLKFCVTGRPAAHIREKLSSNDIHPSIHLHEIDDAIIEDDIHLYLDTVLGGIPKLRAHYTSWPPPEIKILTVRSGKLFVYASTVYKYVKGSRTDPHSRLTKILDATSPTANATHNTNIFLDPKGPDTVHTLAIRNLHAMYALIFSEAFGLLDTDEQMLSRNCLMALSSAQEPLSVLDYSKLHKTSPLQIRAALENLHSLVSVPPETTTNTALSLKHSDADLEAISVHHFSVIEYLVGPQNLVPMPWSATLPQAHFHMATSCCTTILENELHFGISGIPTSDRAMDMLPNSLDSISSSVAYASFYWPKHWLGAAGSGDSGLLGGVPGVSSELTRMPSMDTNASEAKTGEKLVKLCIDFFSHKFLYWLEILASFKHLQYASSSLIQIQNLAGPKYPELQNMCKESMQFISQFKKAIDFNPAHIYISALPLANPDSFIVKNFASRFQKTLKATYQQVRVEHDNDEGSDSDSSEGYSSEEGYSSSSSGSRAGERRNSPIRTIATPPPEGTAISAAQTGTTAVTKPFPYFSFEALDEIVQVVAISPDGKYVASGYRSDKLYIWNLDTGTIFMGPLFGRAGNVTALVFSADSLFLVSGTEKGRVVCWDVQTGIVHAQSRESGGTDVEGVGGWRGGRARGARAGRGGKGRRGGRQVGDGVITCLALDGSTGVLAAGYLSGKIRFWEINTCEPSGRYSSYHPHKEKVASLSFSSDGFQLASGSEDMTIKIRDLRHPVSAATTRSFEHSESITGLVFSKDDSKIFFTAEDELFHILDIPTMEPIEQWENILDSTSLESLALSPDGDLLLTGTHDGRLVLWSTSPDYGTVGNPWRAHVSTINSVAFIPHGKLVVSGSQDFAIHVWDLDTLDLTAVYLDDDATDRERKFECVVFSPDGRFIVGVTDYGSVSVWDAQTGERRKHDIHACSSLEPVIAVSPDSQFLALADECKLGLWRLEKMKRLGKRAIEHEDRITGVVFSPDGKHLFTSSLDGRVLKWSIEMNGATLVSGILLRYPFPITCLTLSGDGKFLAFGAENLGVVAETEKGRVLGQVDNGSPLLSIALSQKANTLIAASGVMESDGPSRVCTYDFATGHRSHLLDNHEFYSRALAISPDGKYFASGSYDHKIFLCETKNPKTKRMVLIGHTAEITTLAFSPDSQTLVSGSHDLSIRVWDLQESSTSAPLRYLHDDRAQVIKGDHLQAKYPGGHLFRFPFKSFREQGYYGWTGWVQGVNENCLFWVPAEKRAALKTPGTARILGVDQTLEVDFTRFVHGVEWMNCYTG